MTMASAGNAQVQSIDPNRAIDGDLSSNAARPAPSAPRSSQQSSPQSSAGAEFARPAYSEPGTTPALPADPQAQPSIDAGPAPVAAVPPSPGSAGFDCGSTSPGQQTASAAGMPGSVPANTTYREDDLIGAAQGVFGKGAKGVADIIHDLLRKQGEPVGYIVGREAGAAFVVGLRYGSGTLCHKIEGRRPVYWTGPSIGFDAGASGGSTFVLVYNLYDSENLYKRFAAGEGQAFLIGGFNASYLRRGDVVLIPIRAGVGLRLGVNGGYMKFSRKQNWMPF
ncbi:EipA family protein [Novosphingobium sp.]|uniref:DUF1134 domain-containing protein n=1 Tax=Novosphingobium sp. TaxID=1874826 RepID=UPI0034535670